MFLNFDASLGVIFTLKALVIVIMGGVGDIRGAIVASFILGLTETAVATYHDPGLTLAAAYILFIVILLIGPRACSGGVRRERRRAPRGAVHAEAAAALVLSRVSGST